MDEKYRAHVPDVYENIAEEALGVGQRHKLFLPTIYITPVLISRMSFLFFTRITRLARWPH